MFFRSYSYKRRSYALRSKTIMKQRQSSTEHLDKAPPASSLKKGKNDSKISTENYQTLTKAFGKIPKKKHS